MLHLESLKTGELIACACELGGLLGGAPAPEQQSLRQYGLNLGLAFQIADDLLDVTSTEETLGKPTEADQSKATFVSLLGPEGAHAKALECVESAIKSLAEITRPCDTLRDAAYFALSRTK